MRAPSPDASEHVDPSAKLRAGSLPAVGEAGARKIVSCDDPTENFARADARPTFSELVDVGRLCGRLLEK